VQRGEALCEEEAAGLEEWEGGHRWVVRGRDLDLELGMDDQPTQLVENSKWYSLSTCHYLAWSLHVVRSSQSLRVFRFVPWCLKRWAESASGSSLVVTLGSTWWPAASCTFPWEASTRVSRRL